MNKRRINLNQRTYKIIFAYTLIITMFLSMVNMASIPIQAASGDGSAANPFLIKTSGDFYKIPSNPASHYKLMNDIDLENMKQPPMADFMGVLDGGGYTIRNISILGDSSLENTALFSSITRGTVKNLTLEDIHVTAFSDFAGILAGYITESTISDIIVKKCSVQSEGSYTGGITGAMDTTEADKMFAEDVIVKGTGDVGAAFGNTYQTTISNSSVKNSIVSGNYNVGGFIGLSNGDVILKSSAANVTVKGNANNGGFVGYALLSICSECYTISGDVQGDETVGGLIGYLESTEVIKSGSAADVTAAGSDVGGIAAYGSNSSIAQCFATGNLKGATIVGVYWVRDM